MVSAPAAELNRLAGDRTELRHLGYLIDLGTVARNGWLKPPDIPNHLGYPVGNVPRNIDFLGLISGKPMPRLKKPAKKPPVDKEEMANLDLDPDAWPKFEKLIKSAAKMGPKPQRSGKT